MLLYRPGVIPEASELPREVRLVGVSGPRRRGDEGVPARQQPHGLLEAPDAAVLAWARARPPAGTASGSAGGCSRSLGPPPRRASAPRGASSDCAMAGCRPRACGNRANRKDSRTSICRSGSLSSPTRPARPSAAAPHSESSETWRSASEAACPRNRWWIAPGRSRAPTEPQEVDVLHVGPAPGPAENRGADAGSDLVREVVEEPDGIPHADRDVRGTAREDELPGRPRVAPPARPEQPSRTAGAEVRDDGTPLPRGSATDRVGSLGGTSPNDRWALILFTTVLIKNYYFTI